MVPGPFSYPLKNQKPLYRRGSHLTPSFQHSLRFYCSVRRSRLPLEMESEYTPLSSMPSFPTGNCEIETPPLVGESNYVPSFAACTPFLLSKNLSSMTLLPTVGKQTPLPDRESYDTLFCSIRSISATQWQITLPLLGGGVALHSLPKARLHGTKNKT